MGHKIASINTYKAVNTPIGAKHAAPIAIFEMITENSPLETLPKPIFNDALLENPLIFPAIPLKIPFQQWITAPQSIMRARHRRTLEPTSQTSPFPRNKYGISAIKG
jgi:hypothetical protein